MKSGHGLEELCPWCSNQSRDRYTMANEDQAGLADGLGEKGCGDLIQLRAPGWLEENIGYGSRRVLASCVSVSKTDCTSNWRRSTASGSHLQLPAMGKMASPSSPAAGRIQHVCAHRPLVLCLH